MRKKMFTIFIMIIITVGFSTIEINSSLTISKDLQFSEILYNKSSLINTNKYPINTLKFFTINHGQYENNEVQFYVPGCGLWFTDDGVWFDIRESVEPGVESQESEFPFRPIAKLEPPKPVKYRHVILKQEFVGANHVKPIGREKLHWSSNFFYGNDSSKWCTDVPNYREIYYENLYNGIDLRYYFNGKGLKYDFIVYPRAEIDQIKMKYNGANRLDIDSSGNLIIKTDIKNIIDGDLVVYQNYTSFRRPINSRFVILDNLEYGFEMSEEYNKKEILIIDPNVKLEYSTYLGGSDNDYSYSIATDLSGCAYITGKTRSPDFPNTTGAYNTSYNNYFDVFITKLDPSGSSLIYSTYIGGSDHEYGHDIAVDKIGNAYVTGWVWSSDFPTTKSAFNRTQSGHWDIFALKLNKNGSNLIYSTFIGDNNADMGEGIVIDAIGNAYITGSTHSSNFPTTQNAFQTEYKGSYDVFILKLNQTGSSLIYSTLIGHDFLDIGHDIAIDANYNVYVTGKTSSTNFPTTPGAFSRTHKGGNYDIFIIKLNQTGSQLVYSTFIGGSGTDWAFGIDIDSIRNAVITGRTRSSDFPITKNAYNKTLKGGTYGDCYVLKLNQSGSNLIFSTFIGGDDSDQAYDIELDSIGNILIVGDTESSNFPVTLDANQSSLKGLRDAFICKLSWNGSKLLYSSYLGGTSYEYGNAISLDFAGNAYITGDTESIDFPFTPGCFNKTYAGNDDVFVAKFSFTPIMSVATLELLDNNTQTNLIYSKLNPYTFRVKVLNTASIDDLKTVKLILDPIGKNIQLQWDSTTKQFSELSDPDNYISIDTSSSANNLFSLWTIDFNLTFKWNYPDEDLHDATVYATSKTLLPAWFNTTDVYKIENDLIFNGTLTIKNENEQVVKTNDLVRGGEELNISGLTVVYENTTDVYPPDNEFNVTIIDDYDNQWKDSPISGEPFYIKLITPNITYTDGYNYSIKITDIPVECDNSNNTFSLRIDANNVTFSNFIPDNKTWYTKKEVLVGVTITDTGGGVVNSSIITHSISTNDGITWENWQLVPNLNPAESIVVKDAVTLKEGKNNLIKWHASDSIGNGPTESKPYRILVDTEGVEFSNAWPMSNDISLTEKVQVGITISDKTSGVNASTIEYSISIDKGKTWSSWKLVEGLNNSTKIDVRMNITVPNGTNNMLKWRATDIAGNDIVESPPLVIIVNTWTPIIPEITIISPLNAITINCTAVNLTWELIDPNIKNVTFDIFFDIKNPPGMFKSEIANTSYKIEDLKDGMIYYWQIISYKDRELRNSFESDVLWFKVELPIQIEEIYKITITGPELISIYQGGKANVSLTITNLGTTDDIINIKIQESNISEYIQLDDYSYLQLGKGNFGIRTLKIDAPENIQPGKYEILVIAISINSGEKVRSNHTITLEIKKVNGQSNGDQQDKREKSDNLLLILLGIIIIIIIILSILFIILRQKKRENKKLSIETSYTTKPLPTQVISIGDAQPQQSAILQQPVQAATPSSSLQQSQVVTPSLPTVAQQPSVSTTGTPTQVPSIIQTAQTPQLPPAKIPSTSNELSQITQDTTTTSTVSIPVSLEAPTLKPQVVPETPQTYATPVIKPNQLQIQPQG